MRSNHTDITIVLDRSGSMASCREATISGYNEFLGKMREGVGTCDLTLVQFDDQYETVFHLRDVKLALRLTQETFEPRGMTALLDAQGRTIATIGQRLAALAEAQRPEKVVVVTITDGGENSSREYTHAKVAEMIRHQEKKYGWEFVYIGANQDAVATGASMGYQRSKSMSFAANAVGARAMFSSVASNVNLMRSKAKTDYSFESADRKAQTDAGAAPDSSANATP